jgi:hypothetical protein
MSLLALSINPRGPLYRKQLEREARIKAENQAALAVALRTELKPVYEPVASPAPVGSPVDPATFPRANPTRYYPASRVAVFRIQEACAAYYGATLGDMLSRRRFVPAKMALVAACYLARVRLGGSYPRLGVLFDDRDHSSIFWAVRKVALLVEAEDPQTLLDLLSIETSLSRNPDYVGHTKEAERFSANRGTAVRDRLRPRAR